MYRVLLSVSLLATIGMCVLATSEFYRADVETGTGEYIVVLRKTQAKSLKIESFVQKLDNLGFTVRRRYQIQNFGAVLITAEPLEIQNLLELSEVDYIEENGIVNKVLTEPATLCNDYPTELDRWGLIRINSREDMPDNCDDASCNYRYSSEDDGQGVYVYVLDTGIFLEHEEFEGRAEWGYTASDINEPETDLDGHGTHVAGISIGKVYGVAKSAKAVAVKVLNGTGTGSFAGVIEGIEWATNDIKSKNRKGVLNLSLGAVGRSPSTEDAIKNSLDQGILFTLSAGNYNMSACDYTPAAVGYGTGAFTVGAMNINDTLASFSNHGKCTDILAPGLSIVSAYIGTTSSYVIWGGTSMAAPFVAGVVARILSKEPNYGSPLHVKNWLHEQSTKDLVQLTPSAILTDTPNRLLYYDCDIVLSTPVPTTEPDTEATSSTTPTEATSPPTQPEPSPTAEVTESPTQPETSPTEVRASPTQPETSPTEVTESPTQPETSPTEVTESTTQPETSTTEVPASPTYHDSSDKQRTQQMMILVFVIFALMLNK